MQNIIVSVFVLFTFVGLTDSYGLPPGLPCPGRALDCPQVEGTELMGSAGAVYKMENGRLCAECSYFVKKTENRWSSALIVRATWVEDPKAEQFDCLWEDMQDPFNYLISKNTQAYAEVVTYDRQGYSQSFDAVKHIFDQVKGLGLPCSGKSAIAEERDEPVPGSPSSGSTGKVIMMRGKDVTIQLEKGQPPAAVGDVVELSFSAGGEVIPVGTWRVSRVNDNGTVEAEPIEAIGEPNIDFDAVIFTQSGTSKAKKKTDTGRKKGEEKESIKGDIQDPYLFPDSTVELIPSLGAKIAALKLYEGGFDPIPLNQRNYSTTFSKSSCRAIWWELNLENQPPGRKIDFKIQAIYREMEAAGFALVSTNFDTSLPADKHVSSHTSGYGWREPGKWNPGLYRVDFYIQSAWIASKNFVVKD